MTATAKTVQELLSANPKLAARRNQYLPLVRQAAAKYGIPAGLLDFTLLKESRYRPGVSGDAGASLGIAQIQAATARGLGVDPATLSDPAVSIDTAAKYLAPLYAKSGGDWGLARLGYMRGPGAEAAAVAGKPLPASVGAIALDNMAGARGYQASYTPANTGGMFGDVISRVASTAPDVIPTPYDTLERALRLPGGDKVAALPYGGYSSADSPEGNTAVESISPVTRMPDNAAHFQPIAFHDWYTPYRL